MSETSDRDGGPPYKVICEREETRDMHGLYYVEGQGRSWIRSNVSEAYCLHDDITNAFNSGQRTADARVHDEIAQLQERRDRALLRAREAESRMQELEGMVRRLADVVESGRCAECHCAFDPEDQDRVDGTDQGCESCHETLLLMDEVKDISAAAAIRSLPLPAETQGVQRDAG